MLLTGSQTHKTIVQNNVCVQGCSFFCMESVRVHESTANHMKATITILSLILHSCLDNPIGSRQLGHQAYKCPADGSEKKLNMDPCFGDKRNCEN